MLFSSSIPHFPICTNVKFGVWSSDLYVSRIYSYFLQFKSVPSCSQMEKQNILLIHQKYLKQLELIRISSKLETYY